MDFNNNNPNQNNNQGNPMPNHNPYGYRYTPPERVPGSGLASAAMILGIASIVSAFMMTVYFPFILGCLAILFALLSKGLSPKLVKQAKAGIICAIAALAVNVSIIVASISFMFSNPDLLIDVAKTYDTQIEKLYGVPSEDILGDSMEDVVNDMLNTFK